jgi:hypothetical protein
MVGENDLKLNEMIAFTTTRRHALAAQPQDRAGI